MFVKYKIFNSNAYIIDIILLLTSLIQFSFIHDKFFLIYRYCVTIYLFINYFNNIKDNKLIITLLLMYATILSISTMINTWSITWTISAFMQVLQWISFFLCFFHVSNNKGISKLIKILELFFLLVLISNDVFILLFKYDFVNPDEMYLVGNKFLVTYYHCFLSSLLLVDKRRIVAICYAFFSMFICYRVQCTTGIIMSFSLGVMFILSKYIPKSFIDKIEGYKCFLLALIVENVLIYSPINIFNNPISQFFIVKVLNKLPNLTGREKLYNITLELVADKPLLGYGYKTDIYIKTVGYGNAQNGLFHIITQSGFLGAFIYFIIICIALFKKNTSNIMLGLYMYVFAMLIGSSVEINLFNQFMLGVSLIYACNKTLDQDLIK